MRLALAGLLSLAGAARGQDSARTVLGLLDAGRRAEKARDAGAYYRDLRAAYTLAPTHPSILYDLARAAALTGHRAQALAALAALAPLGAGRDPRVDSAFQTLWRSPRFRALGRQLARHSASLTPSDTAFLVHDSDLIPENIAYDARSGSFYLGGQARSVIVRVDRSGHATPFAGPDPVFGEVLGMKIDPRSNTLWAAIQYPFDSAAPHNRGALLAVDLTTGAVRHRYVPSDTTGPHFFNDLAIDRTGDVLVTDTDGDAVYAYHPGADTLEVWYRGTPATFTQPNGIAIAGDGRTVLVAHTEGTTAIDRVTRRGRRIGVPAGMTLCGIDGLYMRESTLLGIQAGAGLGKVIAAHVDLARGVVDRFQVLERRHPAYDNPTTGVVVGDTLFYIANSEGERIDDYGRVSPVTTPHPVVILRLSLGSKGV